MNLLVHIDSNESFGKAIHRAAMNVLVKLSTVDSNESLGKAVYRR